MEEDNNDEDFDDDHDTRDDNTGIWFISFWTISSFITRSWIYLTRFYTVILIFSGKATL